MIRRDTIVIGSNFYGKVLLHLGHDKYALKVFCNGELAVGEFPDSSFRIANDVPDWIKEIL